MTFEEKLAARGRKMDEAKAKLDEAINARKEERRQTKEEIAAEIARLDAAVDEFDAALDAQIDKQLDTMADRAEKLDEKIEEGAAKAKAAFTLDKTTAESVANEPSGIDAIQKGTAEQVARAKGDVAMVGENARLVREQRDSKLEATKLRTQMKVNNAKEKIAERREAVDKAAQEAWILDLMDYAEGCYEMAIAWALEAEYTLMEAAYEIDDYNKRFGTEE